MPDDNRAPEPNQPCERCGEAASLATFIPRFGDQPAFRIFECGACRALTWIAEKISE
jgi:ribosomal protein S27AE